MTGLLPGGRRPIPAGHSHWGGPGPVRDERHPGRQPANARRRTGPPRPGCRRTDL